jgi:hypothetical protein
MTTIRAVRPWVRREEGSVLIWAHRYEQRTGEHIRAGRAYRLIQPYLTVLADAQYVTVETVLRARISETTGGAAPPGTGECYDGLVAKLAKQHRKVLGR